MNPSTQKDNKSLEGRKFRFTVCSAEKALQTIHRLLGEGAKVLSVNDARRVFCDVLGVPLLRDPKDLQWLEEDPRVFLDIPGMTLASTKEWESFSHRLDELDATSRILLINAAYGKDLIEDAFRLGEK